MILDYKLTSVQRGKYVFMPLLKLSAIVVFVTIACVFLFGARKEQMLGIVGLTWTWIFLMHFLPLLVIAFRHNALSKDSYFSIDTSTGIYQYREKNASVLFRLAEIDKVIKVVSPPKFDKRIDVLGFGYFFYWKIVLLDGRTLSISCMLLDVDNFPGKEAIQEKRMFPVPASNERVFYIN